MRTSRDRSRGFTMVELLTVIAVIGTLAAVSSPSMLNMMKERRANEDAQSVAEMYRVGRSQALGRGAATMVHYNDVTGWEMREAVVAGTLLPSSTCTGTNWTDGATTNRLIASYGKSAANANSQVALTDAPTANPTPADLQICFSPRGRTFIRDGVGVVPWTNMVGVVQFTVDRLPLGTGTVSRVVYIPPSGAARLQL